MGFACFWVFHTSSQSSRPRLWITSPVGGAPSLRKQPSGVRRAVRGTGALGLGPPRDLLISESREETRTPSSDFVISESHDETRTSSAPPSAPARSVPSALGRRVGGGAASSRGRASSPTAAPAVGRVGPGSARRARHRGLEGSGHPCRSSCVAGRCPGLEAVAALARRAEGGPSAPAAIVATRDRCLRSSGGPGCPSTPSRARRLGLGCLLVRRGGERESNWTSRGGRDCAGTDCARFASRERAPIKEIGGTRTSRRVAPYHAPFGGTDLGSDSRGVTKLCLHARAPKGGSER